MEQDQQNTITQLKAKLFDCNEQISELSSILQAVVNITRVQPNAEGNVSPQELINNLQDIMARLPEPIPEPVPEPVPVIEPTVVGM